METNRIAPRLLRDRLDPKFYGRRFIEAATRVTECHFEMSRLGALVVESAPITYGIVQPGDFVAANEGVRLIRAVDFREGAIDAVGTEWVSHEIEAPYARARIQAEDYLITIAGTVGEVALAPKGIEPANLNQSVARLRFRSRAVDPAWVLAFHRSSYGRLTLLREQRGSIQQHLNIEDIGPIVIPIPHVDAQRYIGDKVRQAERLRARARTLTRVGRELVEALVEQRISGPELVESSQRQESAIELERRVGRRPLHRGSNATSSQRFSRVTFTTITPDRMDASYYAPRFLENARVLRSCGTETVPIASITDKCNCGSTPVDVEYDGRGVGLIRTTDVRPDSFLGHQVLRTSELRAAPDSSVAAVSEDLVYTMSGTIGYAAVIPPNGEVFSFSNTIVRARFSERSGQDPWFTAAFFNSKYGYTQSLRLVSGGIQGHVMPNPFKKLLVLAPDNRAQRYMGDQFRLADACTRQARALIGVAKLLVEHLIDGRITETDLVAAQKALESGDRTSDREILKVLRQSDATDSRPLVTDIDTLYALLDEPEDPDA